MSCERGFELFDCSYFSDLLWNFVPNFSVLFGIMFHVELRVFSIVWYVVVQLLRVSSWVVVDLCYAEVVVVVLWAVH